MLQRLLVSRGFILKELTGCVCCSQCVDVMVRRSRGDCVSEMSEDEELRSRQEDPAPSSTSPLVHLQKVGLLPTACSC